jgi:hypothetical protein
MHFEGFSGAGFALVFILAGLPAIAVGFFILLPVAVAKLLNERDGMPRSSGLTLLGIAVLFEPCYFIAEDIFHSLDPTSATYDRLGFFTWLPMPIASLSFSVRGFMLARHSSNSPLQIAAIFLISIYCFQGVWFLLSLSGH